MMSSYSLLIIVLLVECCPSYETTFPPRSNTRKTTHISEFTDPATGLNPFLDLIEGGAGEKGRNVADSLPQPLSDSDHGQPVEGGPFDRHPQKWNKDFDRRWGSFTDKSQHVIPMSPYQDVTLTERQHTNEEYDDTFSVFTESSLGVSSDVLVSSPGSPDSDTFSGSSDDKPAEDPNLDEDNGDLQGVEAAVNQADSVEAKKAPISKNVVITAALTGASVAVIALLLALCWWRHKMKCVPSSRNASPADDTNIESVISDKNDAIQKKSVPS